METVGPYFDLIFFDIVLAREVLPAPETPVIQKRIPLFFFKFFIQLKTFVYDFKLITLISFR